MGSKRGRVALIGAICALMLGAGGVPANAAVPVRFERIAGFKAPGTPAKYNRVGILETGARSAPNILVLNPGTSASAAYFVPLAKTVVGRSKDWQVWAVERRENQLEDQSVLDRAKAGTAAPQEVFDYYLGWLADPSITHHVQLIPDSEVAYAREWGMNVEIQDLRRVVRRAERQADHVVVGGHSLGGSITTAYATWDFHGTPGADGLAGLVFIDGGSSPVPVSVDRANQSLAKLASSSPWRTIGGIPAPFTGLFNSTGSLSVRLDPNSPSLGQTFALLPTNLKPPIPVTNAALYGYALDVGTSPRSLALAHAHLGHLADSGDPRGWDDAGALTPLGRYADMFSGFGLRGVDGTAWYHPSRLTIDSRAVADGNANPAQRVLDVHATHGDDLPKDLRIYAFGASLGDGRVLTAARVLARQSAIPRRQLTLVNRASTYAHNDPNSAFPKNDFIARLVPFLRALGRG